jgi:hypothetical protein
MSASSARSRIFIEASLSLNSPSSVRSDIDFRFDVAPDLMSLLTELEKSKGTVSYNYVAPSGAGGIPSLPIQDSLKSVHNLGEKPPPGRVVWGEGTEKSGTQ